VKRRTALACAGALLCTALSSAFAQVEPARPGPLARLMKAWHSPLADPGQGRLYEEAARLLDAVRTLPEAVDLTPPRAPASPPPEAAAAQPAPAAVPAPQGPAWVAVLDRPVVPKEDLAYACFRAGRFSEAAALYRSLLPDGSQDRHLLLMLMLSERNAGRQDEARRLWDELRKAAPDEAEWIDWLKDMTTLSEEAGGKQ